jgi:cytochrome P450 family 142 subfamily A polypeptide 1
MPAGRPAVDLLAGTFYLDDPRETYRWLRDNEPVCRDTTNDLFGVATYDGVLAVEKNWQTFSNAGGSRPDTGPLPWMIDLDPPEHSRRRRIVSAGFTPARVRAVEPHLRELVDGLLDRVCERGECDFVADVAAPLPMIVIGDMLGVPAADHDQLLAWTHGMLASLSGAPEGYERAAEAFGGWVDYARRTIDDRRAAPRDDLFSVLVHAEVDGERLDDDALVFETLLLLIGGDETTRQVSSGGLEQLLAHPDQAAQVLADPERVPAAVEEMLRWVSPIKNMARTTTRSTDLLGVPIPEGSKVVVLYESANTDERHFDEPERFDVARTPNDHVAFGWGPHFCLGASLARAELRALFSRVLERLPGLAPANDEPLPRSIAGIERLPVVFTPSAPVGAGGPRDR